MLIDEPQTHQPLFHYSSLYACAEPSHSKEPNARLPSNSFATNSFKILLAREILSFATQK